MNRNQIQLERRKPISIFHLEKMSTLYASSNGKTDSPHRHDYYTVLLVEQAAGTHHIDFRAFPFGQREVHFVSPGQVHQVELSRQPSGWFFTFSRAFLAVNNIPGEIISNMSLFRPFGETPPIALDPATFDKLRFLISEMEAGMALPEIHRVRALGALIQLFLIYCHQSKSFDQAQMDEETAGVCILRDFKQLVDARYTEWHQVGQYAAHIHVTPKHLSQTVKQWTGKTAKELIQDRLLIESKRLLLHTGMTIKEIAYETGFREPFHFSGFFKKRTGQSPSDFRASWK